MRRLERDPERAVLLADQVVQVRRCTARLRDNQRQAVTLCDVDGQSYAEIGQTTFRDHLTRVRMQKAAEMLATRALTVREVAHRVGYRQPAQFAKAFRRYQGVAPSDFRANGSARSSGHRQPLTGRQDGLRPAYRAA